MPAVPPNAILELTTPSSSHHDEVSVDNNNSRKSPRKKQPATENLDNLTVFGAKPNAIVRPLQRETPATEDGLSDGFAKRIKQIEDDKSFLEKLVQKRHQFNKANRDLFPREPVRTVRNRLIFSIWILCFNN